MNIPSYPETMPTLKMGMVIEIDGKLATLYEANGELYYAGDAGWGKVCSDEVDRVFTLNEAWRRPEPVSRYREILQPVIDRLLDEKAIAIKADDQYTKEQCRNNIAGIQTAIYLLEAADKESEGENNELER